MRERPTAALFEQHRKRMFGLAYRMLGSVQDAEDVVQEAYVRFHRDGTEELREPGAWLSAVVARLCIDRGRKAAVERAAYAGPWLPEPVELPNDPEAALDRFSNVSLAFLVLLQRLGPEERAALLLRRLLDLEYAELARLLEKSEAACRQLVHRADQRITAARQRFAVDPAVHARVVGAFVEALRARDAGALERLLAEDAAFTSDGGGRVPAARKVLHGAPRIAQLLVNVEQKVASRRELHFSRLNEEPVVVSLSRDGRVLALTAVALEGERIVELFRVLNPEKLGRLGFMCLG